MTRYVFTYVDPNAPNGERNLTITADELATTRFDGTVLAKDGNGKVRASAPESDFVGLEKKTADFVDARHESDE